MKGNGSELSDVKKFVLLPLVCVAAVLCAAAIFLVVWSVVSSFLLVVATALSYILAFCVTALFCVMAWKIARRYLLCSTSSNIGSTGSNSSSGITGAGMQEGMQGGLSSGVHDAGLVAVDNGSPAKDVMNNIKAIWHTLNGKLEQMLGKMTMTKK